MNFISHFYIDGEANRPHFNFGLILPDLMGMYKRNWKITERNSAVNISSIDNLILSGVLKHYDLDVIFHQSEYFFKYTSYLKELFKAESLVFHEARKNFISHIMLEIIVDKVIIIKENGILERFYTELDGVKDEDVINFFKNMHTDVSKEFLLFFKKFRSKKYLYNYVENDAIIFVLNKILERVGLTQFTDISSLQKLDICVSQAQSTIADQYHEILEIRNQLDV